LAGGHLGVPSLREGTNKEEPMGKWEPLFWILAAGVGFIALLIALESLKVKRRKK